MTHRRGAVALAILLAAAAGLSLLHVLAALSELVIRAQSRPLEVLAELPELSAAHLAALPEARYFLGKPSVVVSVERSGDWVRVLTPARQRLPSDPAGTDPGSTDSYRFPWVACPGTDLRLAPRRLPVLAHDPDEPHYRVRLGPDAAHHRRRQPHLAGGCRCAGNSHTDRCHRLLGGSVPGCGAGAGAGAVSHGCIRVPLEVITAVNALPLGTLITIEE